MPYFGSNTKEMILIIIPVLGVIIGYSAESISAYTESANPSSIEETIDEVVTDTLDSMMNDTINSLIQDTSESVLSQNTNFNQNKFPSILDISQVPASSPQDNSLSINSSESSLDQNISDTREAIANYNKTTIPAGDSDESNSTNKTQYLLGDSKVDESDTVEQNYSSSGLADNDYDNNNKNNMNDDTKSVDYLADFFDKLIQLLFKRS
jgi:hypothetical protein